MTVKLLTEHHLGLLSLKGGCTGSSESTLVQNATLLEITCHGSYAFACLSLHWPPMQQELVSSPHELVGLYFIFMGTWVENLGVKYFFSMF